MLRASHRILKPGGVMSFLLIAQGETGEGLEYGPAWVGAGDGYPSLLESAGFGDAEVVDITADYAVTQQAWIDEWEEATADLSRLLGAEEFAERQSRRRGSLEAIRARLLLRYLITAVK